MSDIEDYFSGDDSDSVESNDSEKINKKNIFKNNLKNFKKPLLQEEDTLDKNDVEDEINDDDDEEDDVVLLDEEEEDEEEDDDDDEDEDEEEEDEEEDYYDEQEGGAPKKTTKKTNDNNSNKKPVTNKIILNNLNYDDEDDDDNDENYLQKFDQEMNHHFVKENHPECIIHNYDEVITLTNIVRDSNNIIIDPFHKTIPFLTKYERARVLGQRAKQVESGAKPFVKVPENIIDGYIIAEIELKEKKIPFIIRRPLPNGACEYWNLRDLELIHF